MRFWDSSALIPLLVDECSSERILLLAESDPHFSVWWGARVECVSALSRLERDGRLDLEKVTEAIRGLNELAESWLEVDPSESLRHCATRLLRTHNLRAGDALQLAAAIAASENHPASLDFVCLDDRLSAAAMREGFRVRGGTEKG